MKYLEDFFVGQTFTFKTAPLSKEDITGFARRWDPQHLHLDEDHATKIHGSLIASGFQTMLLVFEPVMKDLMTDVANIGGVGFDKLRFLRPLRPDQSLAVKIEVNAVHPSRSKPDRGILHYTLTATEPTGEAVFTTDVPVMIKRRSEDDDA